MAASGGKRSGGYGGKLAATAAGSDHGGRWRPWWQVTVTVVGGGHGSRRRLATEGGGHGGSQGRFAQVAGKEAGGGACDQT